jgi:hypothetical protein
MVGVERMSGAQVLDPAADRGLAALHGAVEVTEDRAELRRQLFQVHRVDAYRRGLDATVSRDLGADLNTKLRHCRDKP